MACQQNERQRVANVLSVKVDIDVSEALTGLKALQREARKTARLLREVEQAANALQCRKEIDRLADFILREMPHEIGDESAVDVAIRLLSKRGDGAE